MFYYTFVSGYAGFGFRFVPYTLEFCLKHILASCEGQSLFEDMASRHLLGLPLDS